ncbi:glycogen-binding domain-containing protein [Massilia sp. TSP1-1-2]|uniref:glycogen-binding domain-containing protein n=1 Tax=unclassified Massilia TaxID=2609279 RepID=UPI003CF43F50
MTTTNPPLRPDLLPQKTARGIRFTFDGGAGIDSVAVAGTFNNWVGDSFPLTRVGAVTWQAMVPAKPGRHHYKYVVNGRD